jgi:hypothetical protein
VARVDGQEDAALPALDPPAGAANGTRREAAAIMTQTSKAAILYAGS